MTEPYPLLFRPVLKDYIWGGRNLENWGRSLPKSGIVAESWEISGHKDGMCYIINGNYAGKALQDVLEQLGEDLVGSNNKWAIERGKFPLLVKLLDANQRISVQVHPNDEYAQQHEGNELGKSEMWVVLNAKPDAAIIFGFSEPLTRQELSQAITMGTLEKCLNKIPITTGDHICIPAGSLHSILGSAVIAEIQQNSNTTYRVYDWNRLGQDGQRRELHIEKALDVINFDQVNCKLPSPELIERNLKFSREMLCRNKYFTTERIYMQAHGTYAGFCDGSSLEIWGILSGEACVADQEIAEVQFVLLPANLGAFSVTAKQNVVLLRTFIE